MSNDSLGFDPASLEQLQTIPLHDIYAGANIYLFIFIFWHCWQAIEKVKTDKNDKPYQDVKILNVTVPKS